MMVVIEFPNQERIRAFGEKKTYNLLEANTIEQVQIKEKKCKKTNKKNKQ